MTAIFLNPLNGRRRRCRAKSSLISNEISLLPKIISLIPGLKFPVNFEANFSREQRKLRAGGRLREKAGELSIGNRRKFPVFSLKAGK